MRPHPYSRRCFLSSAVSASVLSVAVGAGLLKPRMAYAWFPFFNPNPAPQTAPQTAPKPASLPPSPPRAPARPKTRLEMLLEELRHARAEMSPAVDLMSPDIAVDGASIMLEFQALLPDVDGLAVYIEGNPQPLAAAFYLAPEVRPEMKLMVRLAQSSNVAIVVRSQGRFYRNAKFVKVTQGGCSDSFDAAESRHRQEVQQRYRTGP